MAVPFGMVSAISIDPVNVAAAEPFLQPIAVVSSRISVIRRFFIVLVKIVFVLISGR